MNIDFSPEEKAFEAEVQQFLADKLPKEISEKILAGTPTSKDDHVRWQKVLAEQGWAAVNWPVEHGGTGWTPTQKYIWANECAKAGAPDVVPFGMKMVAPVIYTYGNEEQKQRFLPDILNSNVWWCQGYSEPNAGSDLASLKTTAVRDGDHYVINGTKTWTTLGHYADWIFCLVRTGDANTKNQEAISFVLVDMDDPGITVSPIITLDGHREVNEIHFDNVRVPKENLLGKEGMGFIYLMQELPQERLSVALIGASAAKASYDATVEYVKERQAFGKNVLAFQNTRFKLAEIKTELEVSQAYVDRCLELHCEKKLSVEAAAAAKLWMTEAQCRIIDECVQLHGGYGYMWEYPVARAYADARVQRIYAGTSEIMKEIISRTI